MEEPAVSPPPTHNSNLSHLSPLVIPTVVEGSAVRPAAFSNPSRQGPRSNESQIKPLPPTRSRKAAGNTRLSNKINPTESTNQPIWTALHPHGPDGEVLTPLGDEHLVLIRNEPHSPAGAYNRKTPWRRVIPAGPLLRDSSHLAGMPVPVFPDVSGPFRIFAQ